MAAGRMMAKRGQPKCHPWGARGVPTLPDSCPMSFVRRSRFAQIRRDRCGPPCGQWGPASAQIRTTLADAGQTLAQRVQANVGHMLGADGCDTAHAGQACWSFDGIAAPGATSGQLRGGFRTPLGQLRRSPGFSGGNFPGHMASNFSLTSTPFCISLPSSAFPGHHNRCPQLLPSGSACDRQTWGGAGGGVTVDNPFGSKPAQILGCRLTCVVPENILAQTWPKPWPNPTGTDSAEPILARIGRLRHTWSENSAKGGP